MSGCDVLDQWPNIQRFLWVRTAEEIEDDFCRWSWSAEARLSPAARAAAYEEWADFFEWRLTQQAAELAGDRVKRHLVELWTDSMVYNCCRSATWARGEHPGEWIPQHERRPDLDAEGQAILARIIAELDDSRPLGKRAA